MYQNYSVPYLSIVPVPLISSFLNISMALYRNFSLNGSFILALVQPIVILNII